MSQRAGRDVVTQAALIAAAATAVVGFGSAQASAAAPAAEAHSTVVASYALDASDVSAAEDGTALSRVLSRVAAGSAGNGFATQGAHDSAVVNP